jgi:hypothetical protein
MSVLTTFRTHPLVHASYLPALFPALLLGSSGTVPEAAVIAYACLVTLPHANLRWNFGPLARVIVIPFEQSAPASGVPRIVVAQLAQLFRLRSATDGAS